MERELVKFSDLNRDAQYVIDYLCVWWLRYRSDYSVSYKYKNGRMIYLYDKHKIESEAERVVKDLRRISREIRRDVRRLLQKEEYKDYRICYEKGNIYDIASLLDHEDYQQYNTKVAHILRTVDLPCRKWC